MKCADPPVRKCIPGVLFLLRVCSSRQFRSPEVRLTVFSPQFDDNGSEYRNHLHHKVHEHHLLRQAGIERPETQPPVFRFIAIGAVPRKPPFLCLLWPPLEHYRRTVVRAVGRATRLVFSPLSSTRPIIISPSALSGRGGNPQLESCLHTSPTPPVCPPKLCPSSPTERLVRQANVRLPHGLLTPLGAAVSNGREIRQDYTGSGPLLYQAAFGQSPCVRIAPTKLRFDGDPPSWHWSATGARLQHAREPLQPANQRVRLCEAERRRLRTRHARRASRGWDLLHSRRADQSTKSELRIRAVRAQSKPGRVFHPTLPDRSLHPHSKSLWRPRRYSRVASRAESDFPPQIPVAMDFESSCRLQMRRVHGSGSDAYAGEP